MPLAFLDGCASVQCGWMAAVISVVSFGSFGVPLRSTSTVEMHPLVMQSYKTLTCFATCWMVLWLGEDLRWSSYGLLSGLFWVPGATCGVYGIQNAGLAVAVGTWSSIIVLTSFFFGIIVFQEKVKNLGFAFLGFCCLILGLVGMSKYAANAAHQPDSSKDGSTSTTSIISHKTSSHPELYLLEDEHLSSSPRLASSRPMKRAADSSLEMTVATAPYSNGSQQELLEIEPLLDNDDDDDDSTRTGKNGPKRKDYVVLCGGRLSATRRQLGVLGATINGA
jgi:hypothetical protein